ncbi:MAG: 2-amino-4-hydroxy-6-hydroxymethyldihydropteridine diphosphokinase [Synergistaceae bacterium]|jgi:2-amino-4-hydroxy-6-hydroxymethyldihydropteridine diphosphokinase|nr:2-amino-4-hydroxy-6-hydroxymethyldihydropteridine diphosphokinase [Synergistaceae bacterium]
MMTMTALGLGSNLGNRLGNLRAALNFLRELYMVVRTSDVFETAPWGVTDQPYFLNACVLMECAAPPETLLEQVKAIEKKMGRAAARRWGERLIDIDILLMDSLVCDSPNLHIPHADMHRRDFVLIPLAQILPHWIHPGTGRSAASLAEDVFSALSPSSAPVRVAAL